MLTSGKQTARAYTDAECFTALPSPHAISQRSEAGGWPGWLQRWPDVPWAMCFVLLAPLAVTWFRGANYILAGDLSWPLNQPMYMHLASYMWDDTVSTGYPAPRQLAALPVAILGALLTRVISGPAYEQLMFALWFGGSGLSMYVLARVVRLPRLAALGAGLFYQFNTFSLIVVWNATAGALMPFYAFLPLHLALFIWCYRGKRGWQSALFANLLLFICTMNLSFTNPALPALMWSMAGICFSFDVLSKRLDWGMWRSAIHFSVCWFAINSFWFLPLVLDAGQQEILAVNATISDQSTFLLNSVSIIGALRLTGLWSLFTGVGHDAYYPWASSTTSPWLTAISFVPPLLFVIGLLRATRHHRDVLIFGLLLLIGAYLVSLPSMPGGPRTIALVQAHAAAILRAFRGGFLKFGFFLPLGGAIPVGLGLDTLFRMAQRLVGRIGGVISWASLAILIFGVLVFPLWTGDVIAAAGRQILPSWRFQLPSVYDRLRTITGDVRQQARLITFPIPGTYNYDYLWGRDAQGRLIGYIGADFMRWVSALPVLNNTGVDPIGFLHAFGRKADSFASLAMLNRVFGLLNVRLVLIHHDMNPLSDPYMLTRKPTMGGLNVQLRGHLESYGAFALYWVPERDVLPMVFAPRYLVNAGTTGSDMMQVLKNPTLSSLGATAYGSLAPLSSTSPPTRAQRELLDRTHIALRALAPPQRQHQSLIVPISPPAQLTFRQVNPTEYDVTVHGTRGRPFLLFLGQEFDPGWHAYVVPSSEANSASVACDRRAVVSPAADVRQCPTQDSFISYQQLADNLRRSVPAARHFLVNGFANGWVITPGDSSRRSTFTVVLDYTPQRQVLMSLTATALVILIALFAGTLAIRPRIRTWYMLPRRTSPQTDQRALGA